MNKLEDIKQALIEGRNKEIGSLVQESLGAGTPAVEILNSALIGGMGVIGDRFRDHEIFLPDVLLAARAMYVGLDLLKPLLGDAKASNRGTVVVGTVEGDLHDIGKNLVAIMLRGAGYNVIDLGNDVSPEKFVAAAQEHEAGLVGVSALLTTTMPGMARVVTGIKEAGLSQTKIIVGGAPVSEAFAREIGADAYGYDAANAVELARAMLS